MQAAVNIPETSALSADVKIAVHSLHTSDNDDCRAQVGSQVN